MTGQYKCACCGKSFTARAADRARGWARFCSKSCKATKQARTTGKPAPWQRLDKCKTDEDRRDLLANPQIIEPLYNGWDEREGELFYAGGEGWDDHKS